MERFVEIDRQKIVKMGGSQYVLVPQSLRRENESEPGDEVLFLRAPGSSDTIIRIQKADKEN